MSKEYAPLPFSYLTGGVAPEKKATGFKKSTSENEQEPSEQSSAPYSIYSGKTLEREGKPRVVSMDVADPYLLSTGTLDQPRPGSVGGGEARNSYAEDPRYRDSVPSESDGGNVFFRSPDGGDSPKQHDRKPEQRANQVSDSAPGYVNHGADVNQGNDGGGGKKLPRFLVSENGVYQYYSGSNGEAGEMKPMDKIQQQTTDNGANPIWDKYYATGGLDPSYEANKPIGGASHGMRPTTKVDDFNTLLRASTSEEDEGSCCCCKTKKAAVLCAVLLTAVLCLGIGFICGWFIFQEFGSKTGRRTDWYCDALRSAASMETANLGHRDHRDKPQRARAHVREMDAVCYSLSDGAVDGSTTATFTTPTTMMTTTIQTTLASTTDETNFTSTLQTSPTVT
ncbi:hypothetical protein LSH36_908g01012 [Paralvinella palmiformis]|uniref:Uncharacterized protein n=1 Tax=Paralvinella palmiformis TaxID=53620 RepID=A0AAD9IYC9_9ANNE|nr:hypothetical protein LSH36_908g01012 [Paralvinella palmiformis]